MTDNVMARSVEDAPARGAQTLPARSRSVPRGALLAIAGVCLLMAAISVGDSRLVASIHGDPFDWHTNLLATWPRWLFFAIALPLVLVLALRRPPWSLAFGSLLLHFGVFFAITLGHAIIHAWSTGLTLPFGFMFGFELHVMRVWINSMPLVVPLYGAVLLTAWSIEQTRERRERTLRAAQLETQLHAARLAALRSQLHPHFLYNALNGISALVADRQHARASIALEQLADLLHAAFREDGREFIPLGEELALAQRYLALQQLRFGDRLVCEATLDPDAAACAVPPLVLQPLVENAVLHGLARRSGKMRLTVDARRDGAGVTIVIAHDGPELAAEWQPASPGGVGLSNTRARLASSFGDSAALVVRRRAGGGVESLVRIPAVDVPHAAARMPELQPA